MAPHPENTVVFWNARSLFKKTQFLRNFIASAPPLIVGLCETWLTDDLSFTVPGYSVYRQDRPVRGGGGLALLVRDSVPSSLLRIHSFPGGHLEFMAVKVALSHGWGTFGVLYNPCLPVTKKELEHYFGQITDTCLVMGDFNARHSSWQPMLSGRHHNMAGRALFQFLLDSPDLSLLTPPGLGTRIDPLNGHTSTLDLCIGRGPFTMAQIWTGPYLGSDHLPIVISFGGTVRPALTSRRSKWIFSEDGWHGYETDDWLTLPPVTADLHGSADALSESLFSVGSRHFRRTSGQTTNPSRRGAPWWTPECRQAVLDRRRAWNSWRRHPTPLQRQTFRRADARCRQTVLLAKRKAWANYCASLRFDSSSAGAWAFVRKMTGRYSRPTIPLRDPSGNGGLGEVQIAELLADHFEDVYRSPLLSVSSIGWGSRQGIGLAQDLDRPPGSPIYI
ncbi:uncharacterized protein [Procambarus clarkii]|uniref:uncharacterized protein n=1 Tax=Procambarus clarkii TaxID=6728 RepID=UPI003743F06E